MGESLEKYLADGIAEVRELVIENNAAIRELRGEFLAYKEHVRERFKRHEERAGEFRRDRFAVTSVLISVALLVINAIVYFCA